MAYSQAGIVNVALGRAGVQRIASLTEDSNPAIRANGVWEYIRDEVFEALDWRFAKVRIALAQKSTAPVAVWSYQYGLPSDFSHLCTGTKDDPAVYPTGYPYVVEGSTTGQVLLTNYDNTSADLFISYIKKEVDPGKYSANFVNCLGWRLAAEVVIPLTEGLSKFDRLMEVYRRALKQAEGFERGMDYLEDEKGSTDWEYAGRNESLVDWEAEILRSS